jgi:hypothetical protein
LHIGNRVAIGHGALKQGIYLAGEITQHRRGLALAFGVRPECS